MTVSFPSPADARVPWPGMGTARTLVAMNTDRNAAMMRNCGYGIGGALFEVLPILTRRLEEALEVTIRGFRGPSAARW